MGSAEGVRAAGCGPSIPPLQGLLVFVIGSPGATMRYKVYVVLNTSNERGLNAVAVSRP
jgi:hypothetical protein